MAYRRIFATPHVLSLAAALPALGLPLILARRELLRRAVAPAPRQSRLDPG